MSLVPIKADAVAESWTNVVIKVVFPRPDGDYSIHEDKRVEEIALGAVDLIPDAIVMTSTELHVEEDEIR